MVVVPTPVSALWSELVTRSKEACFIEIVIASMWAADYIDGPQTSIGYTWEMAAVIAVTRICYTFRRILVAQT